MSIWAKKSCGGRICRAGLDDADWHAGGVGGAQLHLPLGVAAGINLCGGLGGDVELRRGGALAVGFPQPLTQSVCAGDRAWRLAGRSRPDVLRQMPGWWISLLALLVYIPVAHAAGYFIYRRGGLPKAEAFFGAVPGGLIESVLLGEEAGADARTLILLQFLRLILTIIAVPLIFLALTGPCGWVGGGGRRWAARGCHLARGDAVILLLAAGLGYGVGRDVAVSGGDHDRAAFGIGDCASGGLDRGVPPGWAVGATQVVLGSALGARFAGMERGALARAMWLAMPKRWGGAGFGLWLCLGCGRGRGPAHYGGVSGLCAGGSGGNEPDRAEPEGGRGLCDRASCGADCGIRDGGEDRGAVDQGVVKAPPPSPRLASP